MCDLAFLSVIKKEKKKSSVSGKQLHVIIELACNYLYMHCMQACRLREERVGDGERRNRGRRRRETGGKGRIKGLEREVMEI